MVISAQDRLNALLPNRPKPRPRAQDELHFSEKELLEYQKRQLQPLEADLSRSDDEDAASPDKPDTNHKQHPLGSHFHGTQTGASVLDSNPATSQIAYLPQGRAQSRVSTAGQCGDREVAIEPTLSSSSSDTLGMFCIWSLVSKFPYKYMRDSGSEISREFFASERVFRRGWHMHYLLGPSSCGCKPLMLVPIDEVRMLMTEIGIKFGIEVGIPPYPFQIPFFRDGTPAPTLLGRVNSKQDMLELVGTIPSAPIGYDEVPQGASNDQTQAIDTWRKKIERAFEMEKRKKSAKKSKIAVKEQLTIVESVSQLRRAQRYLGLRQRPIGDEIVRQSEGHGLENVISGGPQHSLLERLDPNNPAPFTFEDDPVIISIDVESWEVDHSIITEIGISTLDTRDLADVPIGTEGQKWIEKIRSRHFRIKGRETLRNQRFCYGNPDMFQFGVSEFIAVDEAPDMIDDCFEVPFSAGFECSGPPEVDEDGLPLQRKPATLDNERYIDCISSVRNIILLGHDIAGDIAYMDSLGSSVFGEGPKFVDRAKVAARKRRVLSAIREQLDTIVLYKALMKETRARSLTTICSELNISAWYAHNAGNDARYTMEAFVKIVVNARTEDDDRLAPFSQADCKAVKKEI